MISVPVDRYPLPEALFLLAYNPDKGRLCHGSNLDLTLRGAAVTELWLAGRLTDEDGRAVPARGTATSADDTELIRSVLAEAGDGKPKKWTNLVSRRSRAAVGQVRAGLVADGVISAEKYRLFGLFPTHRITLRDPVLRTQLMTNARRAITGSEPVAQVSPRVTAAAALAVTAGLNTVADRRARRTYKNRLAVLIERSGPGVVALRRAIQGRAAAIAASG